MTVIFALWLITSNYAQYIATYPDLASCASIALQMHDAAQQKPRAYMGDWACIPVVVPTSRGPSI